ncbi:hypothetical protein QI600_003661 [Salmonella enterica]|nr:hypothetical protein [Salmonella enterica]ELD4017814.1 hypothetical protein [Salmonella enterica]
MQPESGSEEDMFFRVNDFWVFCWGDKFFGFYNFSTGMNWLMRNVSRSIKSSVINSGDKENANKK